MRAQAVCRRAAWGVFVSVLVVALAAVQADTVTLKSGGAVSGKLVTVPAASGGKNVAMRTSTGGLIVLERESIRQVKHGAAAARNTSSVASGSARARLTPAEQAWVPKIRSLAAQVFEGDSDQKRRARAALLKIEDRDAIPALSQSLASSTLREAQRLYVQIMKSMPGPTTVYYLVAVSLLNPSPDIRDEARKAIGSERADAARALYIQALKWTDLNLASLAAEGVSEVGDPKGEAIPYLIDRVVFREMKKVPFSPELIFTNRWQESEIVTTDHRVSRTFCSVTRAVMLTNRWSQLVVPPQTGRLATNTVNPAVLDALVKVSDQRYPGYGAKTDQWRRWWVTEKKNRDLQNPRPTDKVISKSPGPRAIDDVK